MPSRGRSKVTQADARRDLAKRLYDAMVAADLDQTKLRELLQEKYHLTTAKASVSDWMSGKSAPSAVQLIYLPQALKVSGHWLLTGVPPQTPPQMGGTKQEVRGAQLALARLSRWLDEERERLEEESP